MATQNYDTQASRNLYRTEYQLLKHVDTIRVLGTFGEQKEQPLNKTDTIMFRRLKPFTSKSNTANSNETPSLTASDFVTAEGVTPTANTISFTDVSVKVKQYAVLFRFSSASELLYEDDIPANMKKLTAETMAEVAELVAYGEIKAGSSVIYTNGSTRVAVNTAITLESLQLAARSMATNRAMEVTSALKPGSNFGTRAVEGGYIVFVHTDTVSDVRRLPGFTKREDYGTATTPVHPKEFGRCEDFCFIKSPLFAPYLAAGSETVNGMKSVGGANVDVYPSIIIAEDAFAHVSLNGHGYTGISPTVISSKTKNHANPSGMFGFVGADFWYACKRTNDNWMTRIEHGVRALTNA